MDSIELEKGNPTLLETIETLRESTSIDMEKLASIRAEIKAINCLNLTRQQKWDKLVEVKMLSKSLSDYMIILRKLLDSLPDDPEAETDLPTNEYPDKDDSPLTRKAKSKL